MGVIPNLILMIVVAWSFECGFNRGMVWAFIGGLVLDLASGSPPGISSLPLLLVSLVAGIGALRTWRFRVVLPVLIVLLSTFVYQAVYLMMMVFTEQTVAWSAAVEITFMLCIAHFLVFPFVYLALLWVSRKTSSSVMLPI